MKMFPFNELLSYFDHVCQIFSVNICLVVRLCPSDDEAGVNPLVATFQDFLESDSDATDPVSAISPMSTTSLTPPARGAKYVGVLEKNRNNGEGVSFAEHAPIQSTNVSNDPESSDQSGSRKIGPAFHTMGSSSSGEEAGTLVPVKNEALPGRCSTLNGAVRKTGRGSEKRLGECGDDGSPVDFRLSRSTVVERVGRSSGADADRMDPAPGHHESIPSDDTSLPPSSRRHSAIHYRGVAVDEFSAWLDTMDKVMEVTVCLSSAVGCLSPSPTHTHPRTHFDFLSHWVDVNPTTLIWGVHNVVSISLCVCLFNPKQWWKMLSMTL